ncbi:hypothetical protein [Rhizobium lusitanum]|uniref:Glycosyltransferase RgtA/B/C/D-like domain-containing protein n=1 Tax=Rhizobium lusitanum TaxID=293958 RepID=A0A7X0IUQ5_9HYPH|nr:hypothetical protein [Rhizobium lusitanum]MBB6487560.1 hypothetical protein [Rhizobium lusitanum]
MTAVFITAVYALACLGAGALCIRFFLDKHDSGSVCLRFGVGSTILSTWWIPLALVGMLTPVIVWATILPLGLYAVVDQRRSRLSFEGKFDPRSIPFWGSVAVICGVMLWYGVLAFYRPPFGDADAFYMTYPKIIAETGRLSAMGFTYHDFSAVGLSGELHFAALMVIATPGAAKLFAWGAGLGIIFVSTEITGRLGGQRFAKLIVAAALVTSTTVTDYLSDGKTELFATLSALIVIGLILRWPIATLRERGVLFLGIMAGVMAYSKFSFIICMLPTVFALAYFTPYGFVRGRRLAQFATELLVAGLGFGIGLLPHLIKNWVLFGNAAAPFLGMKKNWADQAQWFSSIDTAWIVSTFPFSLVFGQYPLMGGSLSLIWLMCLPFIGFACLRPGALKTPAVQVSLCALFGLVCWLLVKPSIFAPRYFLPNLVLLMPLPCIGVERYMRWSGRSRAVLGLFGVLAGAVVLTSVSKPPAGVWSAKPSNLYYYVTNGQPKCGLSISDYCSIFDKLNAEIPPQKRLFVLGFYTYWLSADLLGRLNTDDEYQNMKLLPPNVWQSLADRGFAAVAVQTASHGRYLAFLRQSPVPEGLEVVEEFPESNMPVFFIRPK